MKTKHSRNSATSAGKKQPAGTATKKLGNSDPDTWTIRYEKTVIEQDIPRLDKTAAKQIRSAVEKKLTRDPYTFGKPLRYSKHGLRSLRAGDYRVIFGIKEEVRIVAIVRIGHRRDIYKD